MQIGNVESEAERLAARLVGSSLSAAPATGFTGAVIDGRVVRSWTGEDRDGVPLVGLTVADCGESGEANASVVLAVPDVRAAARRDDGTMTVSAGALVVDIRLA